MQSNITDFLRNIKGELSFTHLNKLSSFDLASISGSLVILGTSLLYITYSDISSRVEISYKESGLVLGSSEAAIVASKNGSTYFYAWCSGVSRIKPANIITFTSEEAAKSSGRRLSKTCEK